MGVVVDVGCGGGGGCGGWGVGGGGCFLVAVVRHHRLILLHLAHIRQPSFSLFT